MQSHWLLRHVYMLLSLGFKSLSKCRVRANLNGILIKIQRVVRYLVCYGEEVWLQASVSEHVTVELRAVRHVCQYFLVALHGKHCALVAHLFSLDPFNKNNFTIHFSHFDKFFYATSFPYLPRRRHNLPVYMSLTMHSLIILSFDFKRVVKYTKNK